MCITIKIKLKKIKHTEMIYTPINSKAMNIVRIQKAQGTETIPTILLQYKRCCSNVLDSSQPPVLVSSLIKNFSPFKSKELILHA